MQNQKKITQNNRFEKFFFHHESVFSLCNFKFMQPDEVKFFSLQIVDTTPSLRLH